MDFPFGDFGKFGQLLCYMCLVFDPLCPGCRKWLSRVRDGIRFSFCFGVVFVTEVLCLVPLRVSRDHFLVRECN